MYENDGYYVPPVQNGNFNQNNFNDADMTFNPPSFNKDAASNEWFGGNGMPPDPQMQMPPPMFSPPMNQMQSPSMNQMQSPTGNISQSSSNNSEVDYDNEPPLLEELGIDFSDIWNKTKSVLIPMRKFDPQIAGDSDLAGPLFFAMCLSFFFLLSGKLQFGLVYGFSMCGCIFMYLILNLMSNEAISIDRTASILGYSLLPIVLFSAVNVVLNLRGIVGAVLAAICIAWCTFSATRYFEVLLNMREQRYLVAYPVTLVYGCFALITVF